MSDAAFQIAEVAIEGERHRVTQEFESLETFAAHLVGAAVAMKLAKHRALDTAVKLIAADARAQIGVYQPAIGAYPEWAPLAQSTEDQKATLGAPPDSPLLRFGDLKKSFRSQVISDDEAIAGSTDPTLDYHEFGTSKMPPRPVLGPALFKNLDKLKTLFGVATVDAIVSGQRMGYRFTEAQWGKELSGNASWHFSDAEKSGE